jgi:DNA-binding CsgD family transcriptional regulator
MIRQVFDPISVIEAGYARAPSAEAWFRQVVAPAREVIDRGLGCSAYSIDLTCGRICDFFSFGSHPDTLALIKAGAAQAERRTTIQQLPQPAGLYATSEVFGPDAQQYPIGVDSLALAIPTGGPLLYLLVAESPRAETVDPEARAVWRRLALHLGAGIRLQRHAGTIDDREVEAVLEPDGRLVHAGDEVTSDDRDQLRALARDLDRIRARRAGSADEALAIWQGLMAGRWSLVDQFDSDGRRFLVARRNDPDSPGASHLSRRQRQVAFYASLGLSNKSIGYALGLAESTVATHLAEALARLGLSSRNEMVQLAATLANPHRDKPGA